MQDSLWEGVLQNFFKKYLHVIFLLRSVFMIMVFSKREVKTEVG